MALMGNMGNPARLPILPMTYRRAHLYICERADRLGYSPYRP
jgi:hypothetical protein